MNLYDGLLAHFSDTFDKFYVFEAMAKEATLSDHEETTQHKRLRNRSFDEVGTDDTVPDLSASDKVCRQFFCPIMDKLIVEMDRRLAPDAMLNHRFSFLMDRSMSSDGVASRPSASIDACPSDLEHTLTNEFLLFSRRQGFPYVFK